MIDTPTSTDGGTLRRAKESRFFGEDAPKRQVWLSKVMEVIQPNPVKSVACAGTGALMLLVTGEVYGWYEKGETIEKVPFIKGTDEVIHIQQIVAGTDHYAARSNEFSRNLYTWGNNEAGQLGLDDTKDRKIPHCVKSIEERVTDVCCGHRFTVCQTEFNLVYSWGANNKGQLGHVKEMNAAASSTGEEGQEPSSGNDNENEDSVRPSQTNSIAEQPSRLSKKLTNFAESKMLVSPGNYSYLKSPTNSQNKTGNGGSTFDWSGDSNLFVSQLADTKSGNDTMANHRSMHLSYLTTATGIEPFRKPVVQSISTEPGFSAVPRVVPALCKSKRIVKAAQEHDETQGYAKLYIAAHGDQAVAWTSIWDDVRSMDNTNHDELARIRHLAAKKRSRLTDVDLRYRRVMNQWSRRKDGNSQASETEFPSACSASAELVALSDGGVDEKMSNRSMRDLIGGGKPGSSGNENDNSGALLAIGSEGSVFRDPGLETLEARTIESQHALSEQLEELKEIKRARMSSISELSDVRHEIQELKDLALELGKEMRILAEQRVSKQKELDRLTRRIDANVAKDHHIDSKATLEHSLGLFDDDMKKYEYRLKQCRISRKTLEERDIDIRRRVDNLTKKESEVELLLHQIEIRTHLYQRLRLRRQMKLQQEYLANLQILWGLAVEAIHEVWEKEIVPSDVFTIADQLRLQRRGADNGEEITMTISAQARALIMEAVAISNERLKKAEQAAIDRVNKLRASHTRLEVPRNVVGRGGAPPTETDNKERRTSSLQLGSSSLHFSSATSTSYNIPSAALHKPKLPVQQPGATGGAADGLQHLHKMKSSHHSVLLLSKVSYSAVVGEELVLDNVSFMIDGQGECDLTSFRSQEIMAVIYEDSDGTPGSMIRDGYTKRTRIVAGDKPQTVKLEFPIPVKVFTGSTVRGRGMVWIGIYVERPVGLVRVHGTQSKTFEGINEEKYVLRAMSQGKPYPSMIVEVISNDLVHRLPPSSIDLIPEAHKRPSPLHVFLSAKALTTCDRCLKLVQETIQDRYQINSSLLSVNAVRSIELFAKEIRSSYNNM